jgi:hypothetical protein
LLATPPLHDRVAAPDPPAMLVWLSKHDSPVEFVVTAKLTVPVNPLTEATVIVEGLVMAV